MDLQLQGQTALVTGSTAGIGYAIAKVLAHEGANVIINGRTQAAVDNSIKKLKAEHPKASVTGMAVDLANSTGCEQLISTLPTVDILINNLGIFDPKPFDDITDTDWQRFFETNVMSGVRLSRAYLPAMKKRNRGRIIFISSESGICPPAEMVHYGMTKSAQLSISRALAETCAGTAVTVNSVLPGPTLTEGAKDFFDKLAAEQGVSFEVAAENFFSQARPTSLFRRFIPPPKLHRWWRMSAVRNLRQPMAPLCVLMAA